jgi:hypothetical protein
MDSCKRILRKNISVKTVQNRTNTHMRLDGWTVSLLLRNAQLLLAKALPIHLLQTHMDHLGIILITQLNMQTEFLDQSLFTALQRRIMT